MKIIHKYALNEMKLPILFGVSLFTFIFLIDIMIQMMENILVKGVSVIDVIRILSFYLPPILAQTIPMGFFLGIMITYSKFTSTSEGTAMGAMGMSINEMLKPAFSVSVAIVAFTFFLQESIIPRSFEKLQQITYKIAYDKPSFQLKEKIYIEDVDDYAIYVDKLDNDTGIARDILIYKDEEDSKFPTVITALETSWAEASMFLKDSKFYQLDEDGAEELRGEFTMKKIPLNSFFEDIKLKIDGLEGMSIGALTRELKELDGEERIPYLVEVNKKVAIPISTVMLGVLGVLFSLGHHRSGKNVSFGLSLGIIFAYIAMLNIGMVMANKGSIPIIVGVWTPNLLLGILTAYMYIKKVRRG